MKSEIWVLFSLIVNSAGLQEACAAPVAQFLKAQLPDAIESTIAAFLRRIADHLSPTA